MSPLGHHTRRIETCSPVALSCTTLSVSRCQRLCYDSTAYERHPQQATAVHHLRHPTSKPCHTCHLNSHNIEWLHSTSSVGFLRHPASKPTPCNTCRLVVHDINAESLHSTSSVGFLRPHASQPTPCLTCRLVLHDIQCGIVAQHSTLQQLLQCRQLSITQLNLDHQTRPRRRH